MPADIPAITAIGLEALRAQAYPGLVISPEKVEHVARECVTSASNFAWVAERDGVVGGAVCALVHDQMWYARKQASVVQFASNIPGDGAKLLREFMRWARGRPAIKLISFSLECDADPRIGKLLERLGLRTALPNYIATK